MMGNLTEQPIVRLQQDLNLKHQVIFDIFLFEKQNFLQQFEDQEERKKQEIRIDRTVKIEK